MHRRNIFNLRAMFRYPRATHSLPGQTQLLSMRRSFDLLPSTTLHRACETRSPARFIDGSTLVAEPNRLRRRSWGSYALRSIAPVRGRTDVSIRAAPPAVSRTPPRPFSSRDQSPHHHTHFRRRPITGVRRGSWGEPASSPFLSIVRRHDKSMLPWALPLAGLRRPCWPSTISIRSSACRAYLTRLFAQQTLRSNGRPAIVSSASGSRLRLQSAHGFVAIAK